MLSASGAIDSASRVNLISQFVTRHTGDKTTVCRGWLQITLFFNLLC